MLVLLRRLLATCLNLLLLLQQVQGQLPAFSNGFYYQDISNGDGVCVCVRKRKGKRGLAEGGRGGSFCTDSRAAHPIRTCPVLCHHLLVLGIHCSHFTFRVTGSSLVVFSRATGMLIVQDRKL